MNIGTEHKHIGEGRDNKDKAKETKDARKRYKQTKEGEGARVIKRWHRMQGHC